MVDAPAARRAPGAGPKVVLAAAPPPWREWAAEWRVHLPVLRMLVVKDFRTRYKRASFGIAWAVVVPLLQSAILALVFVQVLRGGADRTLGGYIVAGVVVWSYFAGSQAAAVTSIVDGVGIADKVWFPRGLLAVVPCLSNLAGLLVAIVAVIGVLPLLDISLGRRLVLLVPALALVVTFTTALALVLSAAQVYFRDVRFLLQATLLVWIYATPVLYPRQFLGRYEAWVDVNPMTGVVALFHRALIGNVGPLLRPVSVSVAATVVLAVAAAVVHRGHDRLFVDEM